MIRILSICITALLLFCMGAGGVFSQPQGFTSDAQLGDWFTFYYEHPEPDRCDEALLYYAESPVYQKSNTRMIFVAFFAAIGREDPRVLDQLFDAVTKTRSKNAQLILLNVLWSVDSDESRALMHKARKRWRTKVVQRVMDRMIPEQAYDVLTEPVTDAQRLDMLWATFSATGDAAPIRKIISVLHWAKDGTGREIMIGRAARWSLVSNARFHPRVYDICKHVFDESTGSTKQLLGEILRAAQETESTQ